MRFHNSLLQFCANVKYKIRKKGSEDGTMKLTLDHMVGIMQRLRVVKPIVRLHKKHNVDLERDECEKKNVVTPTGGRYFFVRRDNV